MSMCERKYLEYFKTKQNVIILNVWHSAKLQFKVTGYLVNINLHVNILIVPYQNIDI